MNNLVKNEDLFEVFDEIQTKLDIAFKNIKEVVETISDMDTNADTWGVKRLITPPAFNDHSGFKQDYKMNVDALAWNIFIEKSGYFELFDAKSRDDWNKNLENGKCPAFTRENAENLFGNLFNNKQNIVEIGVLNTFKNLSWDHKTNQPNMFTQKIITSIESWGYTHQKSLYSIDDLVKFSYMLYNEKPPVLFSQVYVNSKVQTYDQWQDKLIVKVFKNGNCHITFIDQNIPEKLNSVIARHYPNSLPKPRNKK